MKGLGIFKSEIVFLLWAGLMTDAAMAEEAVSSAKSEAASNAMQSLLSWLGSTLVIIAIIIVLGYILKKMRVVVRKSAHMHILEQLPLGPKERLALVEINGQKMLLGVTPSNISLIKDVSMQEESLAFQTALKNSSVKAEAVSSESDAKNGN